MSFRKRLNKKDWWNQYLETHGTEYEELGIPIAILESEQRLKDFLTRGFDSSTGYQLEQLNEQDFLSLFQLVTSSFDYEAADFTACEKRRLAGN